MKISLAKPYCSPGYSPLYHLCAIAFFVAVLIQCVSPTTFAKEIPPYPYQAALWKIAFWEKLKVPYTFDFTKISLREAAEKVTAATGVSMRFAREVQEEAEKRLDFRCNEKAAFSVLDQLSSIWQVRHAFTETGVIFYQPASKEEDPIAQATLTGTWIEDVRTSHFPTKEEKARIEVATAARNKADKEEIEKFEKVKRTLASTKVTQDFIDVSFEKIVKGLSNASKVNIIITNEARAKVQLEGSKITVKGASRSIKKVLDEILGARGLVYWIDYNGTYVLIMLPSQVREHVRTGASFTKEEHEQGERKIFGQKLTRDLEGSMVCDFVDKLAADLGVKIYPDLRAWGQDVKLPVKTAGLTVRQLALLLRRKGVEVVVEISPYSYFCRSQPWPPGQAKPDRAPPGAPVDWSIYLLKRKN